MSGKHTPGPWMVAAGPSSIVGWPVVARPNGRSICNVSWLPKPADTDEETYVAFYEEVQANGHLIAAAPELLSALIEMLEVGELFIPAKLDSPGFKRARAAIAKATGEGV